jgi:anti-sigma factor RsiW
MTTGPDDDLPPELLAAYADGELDPFDRARVEDWLADHPEARCLLEDQESLAPASDVWPALGPPEPSDAEWTACLHGIEAAVRPPARRRWLPLVATLALSATAAAVLLAVSALDRPAAPGTVEPDSVVVAAVEEPYPMAGDDDVRIVSLPEAAADLLVVGQHPLKDAVVVLAVTGEVEFLGVGNDVAGRFPELPADPGAEEAPLLWAPRD